MKALGENNFFTVHKYTYTKQSLNQIILMTINRPCHATAYAQMKRRIKKLTVGKFERKITCMMRERQT